jgi:sugar/nucleoside kinase (ribokinase family)
MGEPHAVAIGDVYIDHVCDLTAPEHEERLRDLRSSSNLFAPVDVRVGGAGLQFAVAARKAGFESAAIIGKIGGRRLSGGVIPDVPGALALEFLRENGATPVLAVDPDQGTGRIVILYLPSDRRLMVSDRGANATFTAHDVTPEMRRAVREADLVHVSGYAMLQEGRRDAVLGLMREARRAGRAAVALDIVPHDIYDVLTLDQLRAAVGGLVDWVFVELPTAHRLAGWGPPGPVSPALIDRTLDALSAVAPALALYLEPGRAVVLEGGQRREQVTDYRPGVRSRGQSATAQADLLFQRLRSQIAPGAGEAGYDRGP